MKNFLLKLSLFFVPILLFILLYYIIDPFNVYRDTYKPNINYKSGTYVQGNRGYQSTELFLKNYKKYNYDSFIFGNSCSMFIRNNLWESYVGGSSFQYNAMDESLLGVLGKMRFIEKHDVKIKNAIFTFDTHLLSKTKNSKGHIYIKDPRISGEAYSRFYLEMFKGFFPKTFHAHIDLFFTNKKKDYMSGYGVRDIEIEFDSIKNQQIMTFAEEQILANKFYTPEKIQTFPKRDTILQISPSVIYRRQIEMLNEIKQILDRNNTSYKIYINPHYTQQKFNPDDLKYLKQLFGDNNVYDYTGINIYTQNYTDYYDALHYRPKIVKAIFKEIYGGDCNN